MAQITEFTLPDGEVVRVESEEPPQSEGEVLASIGSPRSWFKRGDGEAPVALNERVRPLAHALEAVRQTLTDAVTGMDEIELEAGLKFVGETGVILSKVSAEASITIRLKWTPKATESVSSQAAEPAG